MSVADATEQDLNRLAEALVRLLAAWWRAHQTQQTATEHDEAAVAEPQQTEKHA
jgi:hypothetical protein